MLKKLDLFIIKSFLQPLAATFFVSLTVLLLQFLWKYLEDLVGKGLEWYVIAEFLTYSTANLIPLALPLAVLLASLMTFGNLGEKFELVSIKAAGIPLRRALMPIALIVTLITVLAFLFAMLVIPAANLKWGALYYDLMQQKPAFDLDEGVFYNDIKGYSIKVGKKNKNGVDVEDVIIYDHTLERGNTTVITAQSGQIVQSADKRYLLFTLYKGKRFEEMIDQNDYYITFPYNEMVFDKHRMVFDLSQFSLSRTSIDLFKDFWKFKNMNELWRGRDSLNKKSASLKLDFAGYFHQNYHFNLAKPKLYDTLFPIKTFVRPDVVKDELRHDILTQALLIARTTKSQIEFSGKEVESIEQLRAKHEVAWHQKITLSVACFVLFLIGAPLGAIVRKGGFGMPVVFSVIFFIFFFILNMNGEKMVRQLVLSAPYGMWLANMVLFPIGIWLTIKATRDSALFDSEAYTRVFNLFIKRFKKQQP